MTEILFIVEEDATGYRARAVGADIVTQGHTRDELAKNVRNAVLSHFDLSGDAPKIAHLHYVHDVTIGVTGNDATRSPAEIAEGSAKLRDSVNKDEDPYAPVWSASDAPTLPHTPNDIERSQAIRGGMTGMVLEYAEPNEPVAVDDWEAAKSLGE